MHLPDPSGPAGPNRRPRLFGRAAALTLVGGLLAVAGITTAAPAEAAVETYNPFDVTIPEGSDTGFTVMATGDIRLGNGELEGSAAAFGTVENVKGGTYPLIHQAAGTGDYTVPTIDGDPTRALAGEFVGTGSFDHTNRGAVAGSPNDLAVSKFADTSNLTAEQRADFTRLRNDESTGGEDGAWDLEKMPWDPDTWAEKVTTEKSSVADYFPEIDDRVSSANQCLASMYTDTSGELGNELTVSGDQNQKTLSGFSDSMPNWVNYEDLGTANIFLDPSSWVPTAEAPLIIKVNDPTTTIPPINIQGWSAGADAQQSYADYVMLDASGSTASPLTLDGFEMGSVWAPGVDLSFTGSRTTNGQWFAQDVETQGGGEIHHHTFKGNLLCNQTAETGGFQVQKALDGTGADKVDPATEFTVDWAVTAGPDEGRTGEITVLADGTVVDGPQDLAEGDVVDFSEPHAPPVAGTTFDGAEISPSSVTIDPAASEPPLVTVTNTYTDDAAPAMFRIHKEITGDASALVPGDTEFTVDYEVTAGPDAGKDGELTLRADGSVVYGPKLQPTDVVEFTEGEMPEVPGVVWGDPTIDPQTLTLDDSNRLAEVTVTNTANPAPATFDIHKVVTGEAASQVPADTEFDVNWLVLAGPDKGQRGTITVKADGTVVDGPELKHGDRVVFTEPRTPSVSGVEWGLPRFSPRVITLDASADTVDVAVTNTANEVPTGGFAVQKALAGDGQDLVDPATEFTVNWDVTEGPSEGCSGSLQVAADGTIVDGPQDLLEGDVVSLSEAEAPEVEGATFTGSSLDPETVTIDVDSDETPVVTVTNTYELDAASFSIHKELVGGGKRLVPSDTAFDVTWTVIDGPSTGATGALTITADGTVVDGPELKHGDVVSFAEAAPESIDGVIWGETTIDPATVTLDSTSEPVDVTVTNTAERDREWPTPTPSPTDPTDPPTTPTDPPTDPTDPPTTPTDTPSEPTDDPIEPTDDPSEPTDTPSEPTDDPSDPTDDPSDPSDPTGDPSTPGVPDDPQDPEDPDNPDLPRTGGIAFGLLGTAAVLLAAGYGLLVLAKRRQK